MLISDFFKDCFMKKLSVFVFTGLFFITGLLSAQEALKSTEEEYYDFLSLTGIVERPTLGYRTLSDSVWTFKEIESFEENEDGTFTKVRTPGKESNGNIWKNNNLGTTYTLWQPAAPADNWFARGLKQGLTARIYGPEWFNSYNTAAPYGQNDGALWQGRGYNTALTAGVRLEGYGFELTFKPQVSWSQNREFEYIKPNYPGLDTNGNKTVYNDKAAKYGYYGVTSIDAPQRFGDKNFWTFDLGDTEVRYTWKTFTIGFGTQTLWLGPAKINPIIHSNNAASYPKFDIGLKKTNLRMPYFDWDLGYIEARGWWGKLSESDWFDNDDNNNHNLISGLALYYQFPFLKELTVGMNRTMISHWNEISKYTLFKIFVPGLSDSGGTDASDQRISFTVDYKLEKAGFEVYFEWGKNDFSPTKDTYLIYPFHTQGWTLGVTKSFNMPLQLKGEFLLEISNLECSADYDRLIPWYSTFYAHHIVTQGYTNKGQWLAAGIGTGGNSQYLGIKVYHQKGYIHLFGQRRNPDLDFTMFIDTRNASTNNNPGQNIKAIYDFGLETLFYITHNFELTNGLIFERHFNRLNKNLNGFYATKENIFSFSLKAKYVFKSYILCN